MLKGVYFNAVNSSGQSELWVTDGTAGGTHQISVAGANSSGLDPMYIADLNGSLLFNGTDTSNAFQLWVTTSAGTHEVTGISGASSSGLDPRYMFSFAGNVLFRGNSGTPGNYVPSLWITDGTAAGTHVLSGGSNAYSGGLLPGDPDFTAFNGQVLFEGRDAANNIGLWITNGSSSGTFELAPISGAMSVGTPGSDVQPRWMTVLGTSGVVLFDGADQQDTPGSLWETNGTAGGTFEIGGQGNAAIVGSPNGDANNLPLGIQPHDLTTFYNRVVFAGFDNTLQPNLFYARTEGLWISDGTAGGTFEIGGVGNAAIANINPAQSGGMFLSGSVEFPDFTVYDGKVYFVAVNASGSYGLWATDGTAGGTQQVLVNGLHFSGSINPDFTVYKNELIFQGLDSSNFQTLWVSNGTATGTHELTGISSAAGDFIPTDFVGLSGPTPTDFNADGKSDQIFENGNTFTEWQSAGNNFTPNVYVNSVGSGWSLAGIGDFNADGMSDLIFQNGGTYTEWQSNGASFTQNVSVFTVGAGWNLAGTGDFNGDGESDLIFQNGAFFTEWQSTGNGFTSNVYVNSVGAGWKLAGVGDFNGDGKSDLIWQNGGTFTEWQATANGASNSFAQNVYVNNVGAGWTLAGVGDFNGDGKSDLIWQNGGTFTEWQSNGNGFTPNVVVDTLGAGWSVAAVGDFNGDGLSDILFRNTNGTFTEWQSTGTGFATNVYVNSTIGNAWTLEYSPTGASGTPGAPAGLVASATSATEGSSTGSVSGTITTDPTIGMLNQQSSLAPNPYLPIGSHNS